MARIRAFRAIRPTRDKAHLVATRPYYTYKKNVLKAKLEDNPYTFLHIINPEFGHTKKTKPNSKARFEHVREKFDEFIQLEILKKDLFEQVFIYSQTKNNKSCYGVIAGASVEEYINGLIKIHESTLEAREEIFKNYLDVVGFNAEPVLLTYQGDKKTDNFLIKKMLERPEFEFTTTDQITHELWILTKLELNHLENLFSKIENLYIADGHHRSASSVRYYIDKLEKKEVIKSNDKFFLSFIVDEKLVEIFAFHRIVKNLNGLSKEEFLTKLSKLGKLLKLCEFEKPKEKHQIVICLRNEFYSLIFDSQFIHKSNPVKQIDADILTNYILDPILGIHDLRSSDQIEFIPDVEHHEKIIQKVESGKMSVAFFLFPCTMENIRKVADSNLFMPPKSTWVEPKLRSGLTIYPLFDD